MHLKALVAALTLLSLGLVAACSGGGPGAGPTVVRFGHTLTEESSWQVGAEKFAEIIEEETDGRYTVEIFANGQLASGNQRKAIEMLRQGSYDVDITSGLIWSSFDETLSITALPWILPTFDEVEGIINGEGGELVLDALGENGVTPVGIGGTGYRQMLNNTRPIEGPDDLAGLKMRVPGTPLFLDLYRALGADPVEMDFTEVYTALQQGTIDGMEAVADVAVTNNFYETADYISLTNYNYDFFFTTFSNDFYEGLTSEDQEIFMEAGREATAEATAHGQAAEEEAISTLEAEMEVYTPTEDEIEEFIAAMAPVYEKFRDEFSPELREVFGYPE
ncbi:DctP family TRAP transporter solute-binding subunit [Aeromicrobium sp. CTD01-1L150]|uniref:DctP family TRAP transporter solute-binding subunit n=1 Tax=Aeromicrobium sp. CTD01-1L150 TaxID=3341830 RepID=UPI0035C0CCB7